MWLAKLQRMMDELPDKYLEPKPLEPQIEPQIKALLPPDYLKPVGQLTEEEKRLYGVVRQLQDSFVLEDEVHEALHQQRTEHSPDACHRFHQEMDRRDQEITLVIDILEKSLKERLGLENDYIIDGDDIYDVSEPPLMQMPDIMSFLGDWPRNES